MAPGKDDAMPKYFPRHLLYRLRNEIPLERVIAEHLNWPSKRREGRFSFVCPRCGESLTAVNPQTNLGRCFRCEENFNAIDFVMLATGRDFVEAVHFLTDYLPPRPSALPCRPS
jgi:DNA primase